MKRAILIYCFSLAFALVPNGHARITKGWKYEEMFDQADLVVIGRVVTTKDTAERSNILTLDVIGVTTPISSGCLL